MLASSLSIVRGATTPRTMRRARRSDGRFASSRPIRRYAPCCCAERGLHSAPAATKSGFLQPDAGGSYVSLIKTAQDIRRDQLAIGKPTLCAMQGHVIGAGAELALGCDMRIVADDLKFSLPEVGFGIVADTGSSTRLTALVGPARAKWMLISGASIGAEDALAWGLAEWRVPREALDQRAFELRASWRPDLPKAAARQKQLIDDVAFGNADEGLKREMLVQLELFDGPEYKALQAAR